MLTPRPLSNKRMQPTCSGVTEGLVYLQPSFNHTFFNNNSDFNNNYRSVIITSKKSFCLFAAISESLTSISICIVSFYTLGDHCKCLSILKQIEFY